MDIVLVQIRRRRRGTDRFLIFGEFILFHKENIGCALECPLWGVHLTRPPQEATLTGAISCAELCSTACMVKFTNTVESS